MKHSELLDRLEAFDAATGDATPIRITPEALSAKLAEVRAQHDVAIRLHSRAVETYLTWGTNEAAVRETYEARRQLEILESALGAALDDIDPDENF